MYIPDMMASLRNAKRKHEHQRAVSTIPRSEVIIRRWNAVGKQTRLCHILTSDRVDDDMYRITISYPMTIFKRLVTMAIH